MRQRCAESAERTCAAIRQLAVARIGRSLDTVSGSWFVTPLDGRVMGIAMSLLRFNTIRLVEVVGLSLTHV
jgi:hypothetical protein